MIHRKSMAAALCLMSLIVMTLPVARVSHAADSPTWNFPLTPLAQPLTPQTVSLSIFAPTAPLAPPYNTMTVFKRLEKATNVHIKWNNVPGDSAAEKLNLLLASGNLPDAFYSAPLSAQQLVQYGTNGAFIPLNPLLKYMPNVQRILDADPTLKQMVTAPDGNIYSLPGGEGLGSGHGWIAANPFFLFINKTWLSKLHLPVPTTLTQLHTDLLAFKNSSPAGKNVIPMSFIEDFWCADIGGLFGGFGVPDGNDHLLVRNGKVLYSAVQPGYKQAINYFHTWAQEGLIDREALTQSVQQYFGKGQATPERVGAFIWWESTEYVSPAHDNDYALVGPLAGPSGTNDVTFLDGYWAGPGAFEITKANKNPILTAKWINLLYAPYEAAQLHWGPLGDVFKLSKTGELVYKPLPAGVAMGEYRQKVSAAMGIILPQWFGKYVAAEDRANVRIGRVKTVFAPHMEKQHYPMGAVYFTKDELQQLARVQTNIANYVKRTRATWLLNGGADQQWDSYVQALHSMGLDRMLQIYQTALDRYVQHGGKLDA